MTTEPQVFKVWLGQQTLPEPIIGRLQGTVWGVTQNPRLDGAYVVWHVINREGDEGVGGIWCIGAFMEKADADELMFRIVAAQDRGEDTKAMYDEFETRGSHAILGHFALAESPTKRTKRLQPFPPEQIEEIRQVILAEYGFPGLQ